MTQPRSQAIENLLLTLPVGTCIEKMQADHYDPPQWHISFHDEYGVLGELTEHCSTVPVVTEYDLVRALLRAKNRFRSLGVEIPKHQKRS